ncbi:MAG TPA: hypothetical protein VF101_04960 [Gaiellaceae bacterium]
MKAADALGREVWEQAQELWARLRPKVEDKEAAKEAVEAVAAEPDDELARSALAFQVKTLLQADPVLAQELERLWQQGESVRTTVASGDRSVAIGGDASDNTIVTGDRSSVRR